MILRLYALQGYNPVQLARTVDVILAINGSQKLDYHDAVVLPKGLNSPWLDILNVRYFVVPPNVPPGRPDLLYLSQTSQVVFSTARVRVLRNPETYPYAWIVHEARHQESDESGDADVWDTAITRIELGLVDPRQVALIEPGVELPEVADPVDASSEAVSVEHFEADAISLHARLDAAGVVVISEIYFPGWKAYVDGKQTDMLAVDGVLRGVAVGPGEHRIEFRYESTYMTAGLVITGTTALALLAGFIFLRRRERSQRFITPRVPGAP
jgi:hypothetical protein